MSTSTISIRKLICWVLLSTCLVLAGFRAYSIKREADVIGDGFADLASHCSKQEPCTLPYRWDY